MKRFLKFFCLFMAPIVFLAVVPPIVEWQIFRHAVRQPQATIGIVGDSLIGSSMSCADFPELINFGQGTTQPVIWRAKLGVVLDENPQIKTFLVEVWSGILTKNAEKTSTERAQFSRGWCPAHTILDIFRTKEMGGLPDRDFGRNYIRGVAWPFFKRLWTRSRESDIFIGLKSGTHYEKAPETKWWKEGCYIEPFVWGRIPSTNQTTVRQELDDIFMELKRHGVRPIVYTPPLMRVSQAKIMCEGIREWTLAEIETICRQYDVTWINALDWIPDPNCYCDSVHMNIDGAHQLSQKLREAVMKEINSK